MYKGDGDKLFYAYSVYSCLSKFYNDSGVCDDTCLSYNFCAERNNMSLRESTNSYKEVAFHTLGKSDGRN